MQQIISSPQADNLHLSVSSTCSAKSAEPCAKERNHHHSVYHMVAFSPTPALSTKPESLSPKADALYRDKLCGCDQVAAECADTDNKGC